jgi:hypothetical protein
MAIQTLNTLKTWFKTGLKPSQQQFWDTWDSFRHKIEKVPFQDVENLEQTLNEKAEKSQLDLHTNSQLAHAVLFAAKEDKNQKGIAGGYAPLNNFTKLASQYLDIINDLVSGGTNSILSAEQGKILQNQIDDIHTLLQSDNVNLDTLQEIVNAIGEIELSLNTILVNDLTTGGATKALTAEMGKLLQSNKEDKSQKGVSGGYAPLNNFTKLASQYLDIVNDLVSGGSTSLLSAEQGKILQNQINVINSLLASDDINLDTLQEIVNAIKDIQGLSTIIVNDLTAGGTDKALSAEMGKNLNEIKANLSGAAFTGAVSGIDPVQGNEFVTKQFAEGLLIGVVRFIAYYNPNDFSNQYPSSEGSGTGGAIRKGDTWVISGLGVGITTTIGTKVVQDGDRVSAMANTPAQDETNWSIGEANIGYTPANDANVLHKTGNENFQGQKSFANTDAVITTLNGNHNRTFGNLMTLSTGASNAGGGLLRINSVNGNSPSNAAKLLILDSGYLSVGMPFSVQLSGVDVATIDKNGNGTFSGNIIGNGLNLTGETASTLASFDSSKNVKSLSTTSYPSLSEIAFVKGVTSSIQTQLNSKQPTLTNPVTGTGTTNFLPKFTAAGTIGNTTFYQTGLELRVVGDNGFYSGYDGTNTNRNGYVQFVAGGGITIQSEINASPTNSKLSLNPNGGNVGVGTSTTGEKLSVSGNAVLPAGGSLKFGDVTQSNNIYGISHIASGTLGLMFNVYRAGGNGYLGTNSLNALFIQESTGNVGIGTSSPTEKLHVESTSANTGIKVVSAISSSLFQSKLEFVRANVLGGVKLESLRNATIGGVGLSISTTADNDAETTGTYTNRFNILNNGNVGIGDNNPSKKLSVLIPGTSGEVDFGLQIGKTNIADNNGSSIGLLFSTEAGGSGFGKVGIAHQRTSSFARGGLHFLINDVADGSLPTLSDSKMFINSSGNVGIGTSLPQAKLHTYSSFNTENIIDAPTGSSILSMTSSAAGGSLIGFSSKFRVGKITGFSASGFEEYLRINDNGNLGIGTDSPQVKTEIFQNNNSSSLLVRNGTNSFYAGNDLNTAFIGGYLVNNSGSIPLQLQKFGGNVLVGTATDDGTNKLQVNGSIKATTYNGSANLTGTPTAPTASVGTNTTQIATTAFVQANLRPYKIYSALISQSGTNAPVATVLENTLGNIVWTRGITGYYIGTLIGAFTTGKTLMFISSSSGASISSIGRTDPNTAIIVTQTVSPFGNADGILSGSIEIRVYN